MTPPWFCCHTIPYNQLTTCSSTSHTWQKNKQWMRRRHILNTHPKQSPMQIKNPAVHKQGTMQGATAKKKQPWSSHSQFFYAIGNKWNAWRCPKICFRNMLSLHSTSASPFPAKAQFYTFFAFTAATVATWLLSAVHSDLAKYLLSLWCRSSQVGLDGKKQKKFLEKDKKLLKFTLKDICYFVL